MKTSCETLKHAIKLYYIVIAAFTVISGFNKQQGEWVIFYCIDIEPYFSTCVLLWTKEALPEGSFVM